MRTLFAVDGSEQSYETAKALEHLAPAEELILLHVMNVPQVAYPGTWVGLPEDLIKTTEQTMKDEGKQLLARVGSMLPSRAEASLSSLKWKSQPT